MDIDQQALEEIQRYVRYGFYSPAEVERIVGSDVFNGKIPQERIREIVRVTVERHQAEEKTWPVITDCARLDEA